MAFRESKNTQTALFDEIMAWYRRDETECVNRLVDQLDLSPPTQLAIAQTAKGLIEGTRHNHKQKGQLEKFLQYYHLSSEEGLALMCLAEALLRIPDTATADRLIADKLSTTAWKRPADKPRTLFSLAATCSLQLTGKIYQPLLKTHPRGISKLSSALSRTASLAMRPIIMQGMKLIGKQFVTGRTIDEALQNAERLEKKGYRYSYDMLGEAARTSSDAKRYYLSYENAIAAIGKASNGRSPIQGPGISIKLSALHPRYEYTQRERILRELPPLLLKLAQDAKAQNIGLTVDAEEADRLELSLEVFATVFNDPSLDNWEGLGLAVQAYQKRAPAVLNWLLALSHTANKRIMVRLVKGAYWDAEIKQAQVLGLSGYPVFTRKNATDVSYLACAKTLLAHPEAFYPQFGTHNAHTVASILQLAGAQRDFEFQCLHGMGEPLYDQIVDAHGIHIPTRIYAPVGSHKDLLGYLVRRLLENGANTSFINLLANEDTPIDALLAHPGVRMQSLTSKPHPYIPLPAALFGETRQNAKGLDLSNRFERNRIMPTQTTLTANLTAFPIINGKMYDKPTKQPIVCPSDTNNIIGYVGDADSHDVNKALEIAATHTEWSTTSIETRAACLERAATLMEEQTAELTELLCLEAGKQIQDCLSEIREAIDFCRYYAVQARELFKPKQLQGPTGELNELSHHPRGVIVCISPWNFPLAIFMGQISAALVTGNRVIAKPAEQTPLIGAKAIEILLKAGVMPSALHYLPGPGEKIGAQLVADPRISGVMFTGSTDTARHINSNLAKHTGPIVPLIAETGGQNVMIVDSSALPEQVVMDTLQSAFNSAGQRCSALRVMFVQEEAADRLIEMLKGAMTELRLGNPALLETDIGPVIDQAAFDMLTKHAERMDNEATCLLKLSAPEGLKGHYFPPCAYELNNLNQLTQEVFGPILHIIRYKADQIDGVLAQIKATGYGLTLGIHSRIDATIRYIKERVAVGNLYVNRNMIGAVVGVQPFGGEGLSGTGPKAGGPQYLPRLCLERAISINTTAAGGNTTLVSLHEDD